MPSNFNSRVQVKYITKEISEYVLHITLAQTQSSAVLTEDLAEAGGLLALNTEAVPAAAGYMTPDPDLISSTQPIPDHIVSGVSVSAANTSSYLQLGLEFRTIHYLMSAHMIVPIQYLFCPNSQHILLCQMARAKQQEDPMMREQLPGTPE